MMEWNVFIDTHLTNFFFDGARADLTKGLSMEPVFQVTHSFSLASQTSPSMYNFGAIFANANVRVFTKHFPACDDEDFETDGACSVWAGDVGVDVDVGECRHC